MMPSARMNNPNGLAELAAHAQHMPGGDLGLTVSAGQRLKARLHLEVLRVLQWCFHMLSVQYQTWPEVNIQ